VTADLIRPLFLYDIVPSDRSLATSRCEMASG
jgi:hypothetical protein